MNHKDCTSVLRAEVEGLILGSYRFDKYKSEKKSNGLKVVTLSLEEYNGL